MPIQFYFDNLDPTAFQRLISALIVARYGEAIRLRPLRGKDGGRDLETLPQTSESYAVQVSRETQSYNGPALRPGYYVFQVKHHRTADKPPAAVRAAVVSDFDQELRSNILSGSLGRKVDYFFLITNVSSSKEAIQKVDEKRRELTSPKDQIHVDVLWQEHVVAWLDQNPGVWASFPELFAGNVLPLIGQIASHAASEGIPLAIKLALQAQWRRDDAIRFRQINLEQRLSRLFVDIGASVGQRLAFRNFNVQMGHLHLRPNEPYRFGYRDEVSTLAILTADEPLSLARIILEGGPGQGKSTVTQMVAQVYRSVLIGNSDEYRDYIPLIRKSRIPIRIELRLLAEWLSDSDRSVEEYISEAFTKDAGGNSVTVGALHEVISQQPLLFIFDGLDEVGSDDLRDRVVLAIQECIKRFTEDLKADLRVIITSRPPAIAGRLERLRDFQRIQLMPLNDSRVEQYVERWVDAQCSEKSERERITLSFAKRKSEQHVHALVTNPMQLSVLLQFIRLKGEAFPDRRAELYREYFKIVIDRDVEKSPELLKHRDEIEAIHELLGFVIHARAEENRAGATLTAAELESLVRHWLKSQGRNPDSANSLFRIGQERLGLIVAIAGEGASSRYGFEVQPVREYFAAAYVNDKSEIDAHELFEAMVRRQFWSEVARFLAGLRRANEKADLLSRARGLDSDSANGWRSDGRTIVLQLLQEGVFTIPGHVHSEALRFLIEMLDPKDISAKVSPREFPLALPRLLKACESERPRELLEQLLNNAEDCSDMALVWRLWSISSRVLPPQSILESAKRYSGPSAVAAAIGLSWSSYRDVSYARELEEAGFFERIPDALLAERLFNSAHRHKDLMNLRLTEQIHDLLLEQFAFCELPSILKKECFPDSYAIWALCWNLQLLGISLSRTSVDIKLCAPATNPKYDGLSESNRSIVQGLINDCAMAIEELRSGRSRRTKLSHFFRRLEHLLAMDGLSAWIGCRCVTTLMSYLDVTYPFQHHEGLGYPIQPQKCNNRNWLSARRLCTRYFRAAIPEDNNSGGQTYARRIVQYGLIHSLPSHVFINGNLTSIAKLLRDSFTGNGTTVPWDWLNRVPLAKYWLADAVDREWRAESLRSIATRSVSWAGPMARQPSNVRDEILSIVHSTSDEAVSAGALVVILSGMSLRRRDLSEVIKMVQADQAFGDMASHLFSARRRFTLISEKLRVALAEAIIKGSLRVSYNTATAASTYYADYFPLKLPPLQAQEASALPRVSMTPL